MGEPVVVRRIRRYRTLGNAAGVARFLARKVKQADQGKLDPKALQALSYASQVVLKALAQARDEATDERMKLIEQRLAELRAERAAQPRLPAVPVLTDEDNAEIQRVRAEVEALAHGSVPPVEPEPAPAPAPEIGPESAAETDAEAERKRVQAELEADAASKSIETHFAGCSCDTCKRPWLYRGDYS